MSRLSNQERSILASRKVLKEQQLEVGREEFLAELESAKEDFRKMDQEFDQQQLENIVTERLQTQLCIQWLVEKSTIKVNN